MLEKKPDNHFATLFNSFDSKGVPAGSQLIDTLLYNPRAKGLILKGEGGSGKTTLLAQALTFAVQEAPVIDVEYRAKNTSRVLNFKRPNFDFWYIDFGFRVFQAADRWKLHPSQWDNNRWRIVSTGLSEDIERSLDKTHDPGKVNHPDSGRITNFDRTLEAERQVIVSDLVATGKFDKGQSAISHLARRGDVVIGDVITDQNNKYRGILVRQAVEELSLDDWLGSLPNGISDTEIQAMAEYRIKRALDPLKVELHLDDFTKAPELTRKMANRRLMEASNAQVETEIDELIEAGKINPAKVILPDQLAKSLDVEIVPWVSSQIGNISLEQYYQRRVAYSAFTLDRLGVNSDERLILFNPHNPEAVVHWFQDTLDQHWT